MTYSIEGANYQNLRSENTLLTLMFITAQILSFNLMLNLNTNNLQGQSAQCFARMII